MLLHTIHNKPVNEFKNKYKRLISFLYKINKAVPVAISHIVEKEMKEVYKNSISTIERVYNPVEIKKFYTERKYKDSGSIIFINVARFMKQKNQELLIDAFAEVTKEFNNVKLFLVGDGELKQNIEYRIKKYNIDDKVILVGNVSNVNYYYENADIVIAPLFDGGGMKSKTVEALSFGKIFVGTEESLFGFWEEMNSNIRGKTCYQCNTPEEWIQTINNLANDDIHKFNEDVFELFKAKFSYDVVRDKMKAIMEE